jgi:hypothetical protein
MYRPPYKTLAEAIFYMLKHSNVIFIAALLFCAFYCSPPKKRIYATDSKGNRIQLIPVTKNTK